MKYKELTIEQARAICKRFSYYVEIKGIKECRQRCTLCPLRRQVRIWTKDVRSKKVEQTTTGFCAYELKDICQDVLEEDIKHWDEIEEELKSVIMTLNKKEQENEKEQIKTMGCESKR